jgi:hypothetical protein
MERACNSILIVLVIGLTHSLNCLVLLYSGNVVTKSFDVNVRASANNQSTGGGLAAEITQKPPAEEPPWWTKPEIIVPIMVAIITSVIGPIAVSRYGKKRQSDDNTE